MRYVFTLLLAVLFALPALAQMEMEVDNCCQTGRACETDAEWVQGYYDYHADMCGDAMMSDDMDMMSDDMDMTSDDMDMMSDDMDMMSDDTGMMDDKMGMMDDMMMPDSYSFVGQGRVKKSARFTLTPGKWSLNVVADARWAGIMWVNIAQIHADGEFNQNGNCVVNPQQLSWYGAGVTTWWMHVPWPGSWQFGVLHPCEVVFQVAHTLNVDTIRDMEWKIFLQKIDGNI